MNAELLNVVRTVLAVGAGCLIGFSFGVAQTSAARTSIKRKLEGKSGGWGVNLCVLAFVFALALIQLLCPLLFSDHNTRWIVTAGVLIGYGIVLFQNIRQNLARSK